MLALSSMLVVWTVLCTVVRSAWSEGNGNNTTTQNTSAPMIKVVELLKEELQKDNEDYKEEISSRRTEYIDMAGAVGLRRAFQELLPPKLTNNPKITYKWHTTSSIGTRDNVSTTASTTTITLQSATAPVMRAGKAAARDSAGHGPNSLGTLDVLQIYNISQGLVNSNLVDVDRAPNAQELDMAPARGGPVHSLRTKNRLCYRHVMIPEGPKYDSKGKQYLAEFEPVRGRDYSFTSAPKFLLPKCCNCCRKSVLGCE